MPRNVKGDRVGYKNPPTETRFQPGHSGNPKGRPKHVRNFKTDLLEELRETIPIRENGHDRRISKQRAFIKALVAAAIKGDMRATIALVSFCTRALDTQTDDEARDTSMIDDLKLIESYVAREKARRSRTPSKKSDRQ